MRFFFVLIVTAGMSACSGSSSESTSSAPPAPPVDPATVATVTGQVTLEGTPPPAELIRLDGDPKCVSVAQGEERRTEEFIVGPGNTLQNVFVYVKDGLPPGSHAVPPTPAVLDQQKCRYVPRVMGIQVGQPFTIRNSDPLLHNVRAESHINAPFDVGTPLQGVEVKRTFATREVMVPVKCNVHPWMHAYVGVVDHPYFAVTNDSGAFSIPNLPPGSYTIEVWHERLGTQTQQVTVAAKDTKALTFTYRVS